jgi:hypothetical protein
MHLNPASSYLPTERGRHTPPLATAANIIGAKIKEAHLPHRFFDYPVSYSIPGVTRKPNRPRHRFFPVTPHPDAKP